MRKPRSPRVPGASKSPMAASISVDSAGCAHRGGGPGIAEARAPSAARAERVAPLETLNGPHRALVLLESPELSGGTRIPGFERRLRRLDHLSIDLVHPRPRDPRRGRSRSARRSRVQHPPSGPSRCRRACRRPRRSATGRRGKPADREHRIGLGLHREPVIAAPHRADQVPGTEGAQPLAVDARSSVVTTAIRRLSVRNRSNSAAMSPSGTASATGSGIHQAAARTGDPGGLVDPGSRGARGPAGRRRGAVRPVAHRRAPDRRSHDRRSRLDRKRRCAPSVSGIWSARWCAAMTGSR